jgi:hypothetical protein
MAAGKSFLKGGLQPGDRKGYDMRRNWTPMLISVLAVFLTITGIDTTYCGASAQLGNGIALTDPMVRSIQIGPPPVGLVTGLSSGTGMAAVAVPGIGLRRARLVGAPVSWNGQRLVQAIDLDTGVEFLAMLPEPPQLAPASVVRAAGDTVLVRRSARGATVTEAVPVGSVFAQRNGQLSLATRVTGALRRGATVMIPADPASWARVIVRSTR